ncbi:BMC domain-containing protein [Aeromonas hydrophila subsp. hydrophila]|uniref:BMC domain-containing protein n=1 Tax=Aeromonas hydrophila TaxID=644 RepID=UPI0023F3BEDE|nr:BMC domain-containing protein [Aeromonas hydrophila]MDF5703691.1 BMC domain-containing protein [Aeromonas hydrophila subsp. hydrophila]
MKSLGVIETRGLVAAIQAVDAACKAASVSCIGYRKVGSGLVSVCFEGEISAIHTAIERGVAVAATIDQQVHSLVIARPEPSAVAALGNLKGYPPRAPASTRTELTAAAPALPPPSGTDTEPATPPASQPAAEQAEDRQAAARKGKKA